MLVQMGLIHVNIIHFLGANRAIPAILAMIPNNVRKWRGGESNEKRMDKP